MRIRKDTLLGFFLLSSGPIGFQYGAEITFPASEGASNGWLLLMGQISGIAFILGMDGLKEEISGSMTHPLMGMIGLMIFGLILSSRLKESKILTSNQPVPKPALQVNAVPLSNSETNVHVQK